MVYSMHSNGPTFCCVPLIRNGSSGAYAASLRAMIRKKLVAWCVVLLRAPESSARRIRRFSSSALQAATTLAMLRSIRAAIWRKEKLPSRSPTMHSRSNNS
jgi:hypothetical protein